MTRASALALATPRRFRIFIAALLVVTFAALQLRGPEAPPVTSSLAWQHDGRLHVFFYPDCPHCHDAIAFLRTRPEIAFFLHDVSTPASENLLKLVADQHGIKRTDLGVPLFVFGDRYLIGFDAAETTGPKLLALVAGERAESPGAEAPQIRIPVFGDIDPARYSLLALTVVLSSADGFNPCAMWVLIYLISLISGLQDRRKIWWLVGTFVLASGILYFLFMTAWLNTFLIIGYIRPLTQLVALTAICLGASHLYELAWNRGEVGDAEQRQKTMRRILRRRLGL